MNQFFYLPPVARSVVAALEKAGFRYCGVEEEWDDDLPDCCGFRISIDDAWGADEWGDDTTVDEGARCPRPNHLRYLRVIWKETADAWEIELSLIDHQERASIAVSKVINLIQSATRSHRYSPGQLCLFEETAI